MAGVSARCSHGSSPHTFYEGAASKCPSKCRYCGAKLHAIPTVWGVVDWRGDGRYTKPAKTYNSPQAAEAHLPTFGEPGYNEKVVRSFTI